MAPPHGAGAVKIFLDRAVKIFLDRARHFFGMHGIVEIWARASQRICTFKIWLRYNRGFISPGYIGPDGCARLFLHKIAGDGPGDDHKTRENFPVIRGLQILLRKIYRLLSIQIFSKFRKKFSKFCDLPAK